MFLLLVLSLMFLLLLIFFMPFFCLWFLYDALAPLNGNPMAPSHDAPLAYAS
jgi:hypothetical protein